MRSDEELMERVSRGHFEAYEEIVRRHQDTAVGIAYHVIGDSDQAEEIAQEAFLKILRNAENYEPTATFKTYLTRVVTRLCYDWTEKNRPLQLDPQQDRLPWTSHNTPLDDTLEEERTQALREGLRELPTRQRAALVLQHFEGFTYEEIAAALETTEKAVEGLLSRARNNLRESLTDRIEI